MTREDVIKAMAFPIWETWMVSDGLAHNATQEEFDDRYLQWIEAESGMKGRLKIAYAVRDAEAALSALESLGIAIVPVEPTVVMINAGHEQVDESEGGFTECTGAVTAKNAWRAMLSASPLRKTDGEEE